MSGDWLDDDFPLVPLEAAEPAGDLVTSGNALQTAWKALSDQQRAFLNLWMERKFNASKTAREMGVNMSTLSHTWGANPNFALAKKILKRIAMGSVLDKAHNVLRLEECAQELLEPKPILHQGMDTGFRENQAAAAAKVTETLLRVGGHLQDEQARAPMVGPALIVQVTNKIGGEVISHTVIGVTPELPPPAESWIDADA